jgi:hypothetical protein
MTWLAPWVFAGLLVLAVPILIHLLTRRRSRVQRFPTLRFIGASPMVPMRALRPSDPLLLAIRCAVIGVAVAALAQPVLRTAVGERDAAGVLARVIIVDTSRSMRRGALAGGSAVDAARREAVGAVAQTAVSVTVESASPSRELRAASEWLERQSGRRSILLISDFQTGALDEADLAVVARDVGLSFTRVAVRGDTSATEVVSRLGDLETLVRATFEDGSTDARWSFRAAGADPSPVLLLTAANDEAVASATLDAVQRFISPPEDSAHALAIVFPGYDGRAQLERIAQPADAPWMGDVAASAWRDTSIAGIGRAAIGGRERLLLFANVAPGSFESAALIVAAANALSGRVPAAELEPSTIADAQLAAWRREPASVVLPVGDGGESDGRWLWLLALLLLGVEAVLRRSRPPARGTPAGEARLDRVA